MITIDQAIDRVIGKEGKYSNNPKDRGGETMWGITVDVARRHGYNGPMSAMPRGVAVKIYNLDYIITPKFDKLWNAESHRIAYKLFDIGVNCGVQFAGEAFQRCLNVLNREGKDYPDLKQDGKIGPATLQAHQKFMQLRKLEGEMVLLKMLNVCQGFHYIAISEKRPANEEFVFGWFRNRIEIPMV